MIVQSIYIMLNDGRCIFEKSYATKTPPKNLVTGMISAIQTFVHEVTGDYPEIFSTTGFSFHIKRSGPVTIIVSSYSKLDLRAEINEIALRFISNYSYLIPDWNGKTNIFTSFEKEITKVFGEISPSKRVMPTKSIDGFTLVNIDEDLQQIIHILMVKREVKVDELTEICMESDYLITSKLERLLLNGYIGKYNKNNELIYFL